MGNPIKSPHKSFRKKQKKSKLPFFLTALLILSAILFASVYNNGFRPVLKSLAAYRAEYISNEAVNAAVAEILGKRKITYADAVSVYRDNQGRVTSLCFDFSEINLLKSLFAERINKAVHKNKKVTVYIPLGNLTGTELFSGLGPLIPVNMTPASNTTVNFRSDFSAAGINQTRHTLSLEVISKISLLLPGNADTETVSRYEIPVTESIIVGLTPDTLTQVVTNDGNIREDIMNLQ